MSSAPNSFPISLRSWASDAKDNDPKHLPTIIQRINFERGGFHNITEESLRQEIAEAELSNDNGEEGSSEEEEEEEPDRAKELLVARDELLMHIEYYSTSTPSACPSLIAL
jgi:mediator of RNA polymerase II transcription subunit 17